MPRGPQATQLNRLNSIQAKVLAREIEGTRSDVTAQPVRVGQGFCVIELRSKERPYALVGKVKSREEWEKVR